MVVPRVDIVRCSWNKSKCIIIVLCLEPHTSGACWWFEEILNSVPLAFWKNKLIFSLDTSNQSGPKMNQYSVIFSRKNTGLIHTNMWLTTVGGRGGRVSLPRPPPAEIGGIQDCLFCLCFSRKLFESRTHSSQACRACYTTIKRECQSAAPSLHLKKRVRMFLCLPTHPNCTEQMKTLAPQPDSTTEEMAGAYEGKWWLRKNSQKKKAMVR